MGLNNVAFFHELKALLKTSIVLGFFVGFALPDRQGFPLQLLQVLLELFLGRQRHWELPFISVLLHELIPIASSADQLIDVLEVEELGDYLEILLFLLLGEFIQQMLQVLEGILLPT